MKTGDIMPIEDMKKPKRNYADREGFLRRIISLAKEYYERYKGSKNKTRIILSAILAILIVWGFLSMIGMYISKINLRAGFMDVSGRIEGYEYHAGTKVSGKVAEVFVDEGDSVKEGQPIGRIYSKQLEAAYQEAVAQKNLAEIEYNHYMNLVDRNAIAKIQRDRAVKDFRVAEENLRRAAADLEDATILAPISGRVVTKIVRPGEVVAAGTPIVTIINMDDLFLKVFLSTEFAGKIHIGDEAKIFPDALTDKEFKAVVSKIAEKAQFTPKNVETKSQRAKLVFEIRLKVLDNKDGDLKPGMPSDGVIKFNRDVPWKKYSR